MRNAKESKDNFHVPEGALSVLAQLASMDIAPGNPALYYDYINMLFPKASELLTELGGIYAINSQHAQLGRICISSEVKSIMSRLSCLFRDESICTAEKIDTGYTGKDQRLYRLVLDHAKMKTWFSDELQLLYLNTKYGLSKNNIKIVWGRLGSGQPYIKYFGTPQQLTEDSFPDKEFPPGKVLQKSRTNIFYYTFDAASALTQEMLSEDFSTGVLVINIPFMSKSTTTAAIKTITNSRKCNVVLSDVDTLRLKVDGNFKTFPIELPQLIFVLTAQLKGLFSEGKEENLESFYASFAQKCTRKLPTLAEAARNMKENTPERVEIIARQSSYMHAHDYRTLHFSASQQTDALLMTLAASITTPVIQSLLNPELLFGINQAFGEFLRMLNNPDARNDWMTLFQQPSRTAVQCVTISNSVSEDRATFEKVINIIKDSRYYLGKDKDKAIRLLKAPNPKSDFFFRYSPGQQQYVLTYIDKSTKTIRHLLLDGHIEQAAQVNGFADTLEKALSGNNTTAMMETVNRMLLGNLNLHGFRLANTKNQFSI